MDHVGDVGDVAVDGTARCCVDVDVGIDTDVAFAFAVVVVECPVSAAVVDWKT